MAVLKHDGKRIPRLKFPKDPGAVKDYALAWGDWLDEGETITSSTWTSDLYTIESQGTLASLTVNDVTYTDLELVWLSGGTPQTDGLITNRITTSLGRADERSFLMPCQDL